MSFYERDLLSFAEASRGVRFALRAAHDEDVDAMLAIEERSFEYPWSREDFEFCLHSNRCEAIVATRDGETAGYAIYELGRACARLISCATAESSRRQGCGSSLVECVASRLDARRREIACVVREGNEVARLFLRSQGFRERWVERRYYSGVKENALRMSRRLDDNFALATSSSTRRVG